MSGKPTHNPGMLGQCDPAKISVNRKTYIESREKSLRDGRPGHSRRLKELHDLGFDLKPYFLEIGLQSFKFTELQADHWPAKPQEVGSGEP